MTSCRCRRAERHGAVAELPPVVRSRRGHGGPPVKRLLPRGPLPVDQAALASRLAPKVERLFSTAAARPSRPRGRWPPRSAPAAFAAAEEGLTRPVDETHRDRIRHRIAAEERAVGPVHRADAGGREGDLLEQRPARRLQDRALDPVARPVRVCECIEFASECPLKTLRKFPAFSAKRAFLHKLSGLTTCPPSTAGTARARRTRPASGSTSHSTASAQGAARFS